MLLLRAGVSHKRPLCDGVLLGLLLELAVEDAVTVEVLLGDGRPVIHTVHHGDGHATGHMGLNVAMEEESTGVGDLVSENHPGVVALSRVGGVLHTRKVSLLFIQVDPEEEKVLTPSRRGGFTKLNAVGGRTAAASATEFQVQFPTPLPTT